MRKQLHEQIERLKAAGATYVDARWYPVEEANQLMMWNGNLKNAASSRESGVGIRVLYKGAWGFSASSELGSLNALFDKALDNARVAAERVTFPIRLAEKESIQGSFNSPNQKFLS
jgi:TldD protein